MRLFLTRDEREALRRVLKMLGLRPSSLAASIFFGVAGLGSAIGLAAVSAWLIARASQMPPVLYLTVAAVAVRMFGILRALLRYAQRLASHKVALEGMDSLRLGIYRRLATGPIDNVASIQRGDLLARTGADIEAVGDFVVKSLLPFSVAAIVGVGTVIGFAFLSVPAALVLAVGMVLSGVVAPILMSRSARIAEQEEQAARQELSITTLSVLETADEQAVSGTLSASFARLKRTSTALDQARGLAARPAALATALDRFAMGATVVGVLLVAVPQTNAGLVAAVALAVLVLTPLAAFEGTADLGAAAIQLIRSARAAKRITDLLGPEGASVGPIHEVEVRDKPQLIATDLAVGWPGRPTTLAGVDLSLTPGQVIAVVGPSGIGKSTLLYTLAGMLPPKFGEADLNGVPLWRGDRDDVARQVALTTEDAHVFATTVYENVRVARADLTRDEAARLLGEVGLGEWVSSLPSGLDTLLGVGAMSISGGERRRLLLARALASPAPLLLLDEPGEHLDAQTADRVLQALLAGRGRRRGLIIVTHRLRGLEEADYVMRLQPRPDRTGPAVVGNQGTHGDLLASVPEYHWAAMQEGAQ